ncbi:MAG: hypothetical protein GWO87_01100 [Xanthomonadaceae bacterium]|nr:hypothetical protein [Rhodospirillaceae bacterium]NIA17772.1 hypothetical protein [Xanthomonadaceae bacterium]
MLESYLQKNIWLIILTLIWVLPWKGVALWKAAQNKHLAWFIAMLIINSFAGLEILYIFIFSKTEKNKRKFNWNLFNKK